jgi:hypothetical protein
MTDLDIQLDVPTSIPQNVPRRPGVWRAISLLAVASALVISAWSILQARSASDVAVPERAPIELEDATVQVSGLAAGAGSKLVVLGLGESTTTDLTGAQTSIELPEATAAIVALVDNNDAIVGLAGVPIDRPTVIEVSARSTAEALLLLSPGVLVADVDQSFANVEFITADPAFAALVNALATNPTISQPNDAAEQAFAEIADRLQAAPPAADQGCDSVLARNAYPSTGTCVQPKDTGIVITNEQDRWALLFAGPADYTTLCAAVAPTGASGDEVLVPFTDCGGEAILVAPGPVVDQGDAQQAIDDRVRAAAAMNALYDYAGPFADLAGASAGFVDEAPSHLVASADSVVGTLSGLIDSDPAFAAAMDVPRMSSTALDRHTAAIAAARSIVAASDSTELIPNRLPGNQRHDTILDFFERAGERMVNPRLDWQWDADAIGTVSFGDNS